MTGHVASPLEILTVVAAGAGVFGLIVGARRLGPLVSLSAEGRERVARLAPLLELTLWILYVAGSLAWVFGERGTIPVVAFAVIMAGLLGAGWFAVRDYLAGAVLRAERLYRPGDGLRVGETSGTVRSVGLRTLHVELESGELLVLPYRKLSGVPLVRGARGPGGAPHRFTVETGPLAVPEARRLARRAALLSHWAAPRHDVQVRTLGEGRLELTVRLLTPERACDLEREVRAALGPARAVEPAPLPRRRTPTQV